MIAALFLLLALPVPWPPPVAGSLVRQYDALRVVITADSTDDTVRVECCYRVDTLITYTGVPCPWVGWSAHVNQYREEP